VASSRDPGRSRTTIVVLVLLSITIIALDAGGFGPVNGLKSGVGTVFSPVRSVGDAVFGPVGDAWNGIFNRTDLRQENEELRRRLDELSGEQAQAEQAAAELQAMRDLLDLPNVDDIVKTHAEVIGGPVSNFDRTIQINKGANAGIRRGMPVITAAGLVGRVVEVSLNTANVQLITDAGFNIGVKHVGADGDIGVARGQGEGEPLRVDVGLDATTEIHTGDVFMTSGVDRSLFPPGLVVGRATEPVEAVTPTGDETSASTTTTSTTAPGRTIDRTIDLIPGADLEHLTFVSVMLWNPS
jgi:rod shape-determining protein MreC